MSKSAGYTGLMTTAEAHRITRKPGVCGGRACIDGHRVRVIDVVTWSEHQGMTPDEIVSHVPSLTLGDVHAALAYYFDHVDEIQEEARAERTLADEARRSHPSLIEAALSRERLEKSA